MSQRMAESTDNPLKFKPKWMASLYKKLSGGFYVITSQNLSNPNFGTEQLHKANEVKIGIDT